MVQTFAEVIDRFDGPAGFARAVGMSPGAAKQAKRRNSISAQWFAATVEAARKRGLKDVINEKTLNDLAQRRRSTASASSTEPPASL